MRFTAAARSGAVSASVPSKSKSTAPLFIAGAAHEIVHVAVDAEAVASRDGVVRHADQLFGAQSRRPRPARKLRGLDEALVVVRPFGKETEQVFGAHDSEEIGLRIAVDGGKEDPPARPHEARASAHHARRLRNVL